MNRDGTDGIIYVYHVISEPYTEYYQETRNNTYDSCACTIGYITGSRNGYKTCQGSVVITVATIRITNRRVLRILKPDWKSQGEEHCSQEGQAAPGEGDTAAHRMGQAPRR